MRPYSSISKWIVCVPFFFSPPPLSLYGFAVWELLFLLGSTDLWPAVWVGTEHWWAMPPPASPHLRPPELWKCFQTWIRFCSSYINCSHTPLIPGHVKWASGLCFYLFFSPLLWLFLSSAEALPILVLKQTPVQVNPKKLVNGAASVSWRNDSQKIETFH